jgi:multidrug efflux system membrane fusion protein
MKKKLVVSTALLTAVLAAGGLLYFTHIHALDEVAAAPAPPAVPVVAGTVAQHDVPIYLSGVGTVIAYNTDVVRAQIQGQIISINFTEGQTVHAGDLLAQIDPRPYQALIDQYTGNLERDQAQLINAQANLTRYTTLGDKGWATPQLLETQKAQVGQLQAAIKADQALIDAAKVQLSFTRLTSPIDGVAGIRQIDVGNIISPSSTNGLVVVTQLDPISLIFTLPETSLPQIQQQQQTTKTPPRQQRDPADHRLDPAQGQFCQQVAQALAGPARQRAPARRYAAQRLDRSRSGRAARSERALRLCHQPRQHRGNPANQGRANQ